MPASVRCVIPRLCACSTAVGNLDSYSGGRGRRTAAPCPPLPWRFETACSSHRNIPWQALNASYDVRGFSARLWPVACLASPLLNDYFGNKAEIRYLSADETSAVLLNLRFRFL